MTVVYIYLGTATYSGSGDFEWKSPKLGARHKVMLFISQQVDEPQNSDAVAALTRFGFSLIELTGGQRLLVESLNDPSMRAFQKHYEGALDAGCSVAWYPKSTNVTAT